MKKLGLVLLIAVGCQSAACSALIGDSTNRPEGVDFSCVLDDERLSLPFRDPAAAQEWLAKTIRALEEAEYIGTIKDSRTITPQTAALIADLRDLGKRARSCLR